MIKLQSAREHAISICTSVLCSHRRFQIEDSADSHYWTRKKTILWNIELVYFRRTTSCSSNAAKSLHGSLLKQCLDAAYLLPLTHIVHSAMAMAAKRCYLCRMLSASAEPYSCTVFSDYTLTPRQNGVTGWSTIRMSENSDFSCFSTHIRFVKYCVIHILAHMHPRDLVRTSHKNVHGIAHTNNLKKIPNSRVSSRKHNRCVASLIYSIFEWRSCYCRQLSWCDSATYFDVSTHKHSCRGKNVYTIVKFSNFVRSPS